MVIGALLPWATVSAAFVGTINKAGTDGDGVITLLFGLAIAGMGWPLLTRGRLPLWAAITVLVLGVLATLICLYDIVDVSSKADDLEGVATASVGIGLWLSAIAAVGVCAGGGLELVAKRPGPATTPFQPPMCASPPPPPPGIWFMASFWPSAVIDGVRPPELVTGTP